MSSPVRMGVVVLVAVPWTMGCSCGSPSGVDNDGGAGDGGHSMRDGGPRDAGNPPLPDAMPDAAAVLDSGEPLDAFVETPDAFVEAPDAFREALDAGPAGPCALCDQAHECCLAVEPPGSGCSHNTADCLAEPEPERTYYAQDCLVYLNAVRGAWGGMPPEVCR